MVGIATGIGNAVSPYGHSAGRRDPKAHAEILALREAAAKIGNYRRPDGELGLPLMRCLE